MGGTRRRREQPATRAWLLRQKLRAAFERIADSDVDRRTRRQRREDFAFHMIDWMDDLFQLAKLYRSPHRHSQREFDRILSGFLIHAPAHIIQAARLGAWFSDVFGPEPIFIGSGKSLPPLGRLVPPPFSQTHTSGTSRR